MIEASAFLLSLLLYTNPEMAERKDFFLGGRSQTYFRFSGTAASCSSSSYFPGCGRSTARSGATYRVHNQLDPSMTQRIEWFQAVDPILIILLQVPIGKLMSRYRDTVDDNRHNHFNGGGFLGGLPGDELRGALDCVRPGLLGVGEMMFSPRSVEYVSMIAPKEETGLYIGYGFLPLAIGLGGDRPSGLF